MKNPTDFRELVFLALHFKFMCVPTVLAYLNNKKKIFPLLSI